MTQQASGEAGGAAIVLRTEADRARARAQMARICRHIATAPSATLTLEQWMSIEHMRADATVRSLPVAGAGEPASAEQRALLGVDDASEVDFRHVMLTCGDTVLSEARNWYLPGRLTADMRAQLAHGTSSYGRVILPLGPRRESIATDWRWEAQLAEGQTVPMSLNADDVAFVHMARVFDGEGQVLALVEERYRYALLALDDER